MIDLSYRQQANALVEINAHLEPKMISDRIILQEVSSGGGGVIDVHHNTDQK